MLSAYRKAICAVDNLIGIERGAEEQERVLAHLHQEQQMVEERVIALHAKVEAVDAEISKKLDDVSDYFFIDKQMPLVSSFSRINIFVQLLDSRTILGETRINLTKP